MNRARHSRLSLGLLLVAAGLVLRALLPTGWMPVPHEAGLRIALCTDAGERFVLIGPDGRITTDPAAPAQPRDPCPFGLAAAHPADLPVPPALPLPPADPATPIVAALPAAAPAPWPSIRPPATGPPAFA